MSRIPLQPADGFTIVEVLVAATIMIALCVGTLVVFEQAIKLNMGNNIRAQAHTILQKEVEFYRALKYEPVDPDPLLDGKTETVTRTNVQSADGFFFDIKVTIDNDPLTAGVQTSGNTDCKFKEITIEATPHTPQQGWLADLKTKVTFQRVRLIG